MSSNGSPREDNEGCPFFSESRYAFGLALLFF
jgi:hypothetical protein